MIKGQNTVKLRQERARSSSKKDFLLRVPDGCAFLTGARSSIRFDFLIAEGFVKSKIFHVSKKANSAKMFLKKCKKCGAIHLIIKVL